MGLFKGNTRRNLSSLLLLSLLSLSFSASLMAMDPLNPLNCHFQKLTEGIYQTDLLDPVLHRKALLLRDQRHTEGKQEVLVTVSSLSLPHDEIKGIKGLPHYEYRNLFKMLHAVRRPNTKVVFVSSMKIPDVQVLHYLKAAGVKTAGKPLSNLLKENNIELISLNDPTIEHLALKILDPRNISIKEKILRAIGNKDDAVLDVFMSTDSEGRLSAALGVPLEGATPIRWNFGGKVESRLRFREANIDLPNGFEPISSEAQLVDAISSLWEQRPYLTKMVVKQDQGVSGQGNAFFRLDRPFIVDRVQRKAYIKEQLKKLEMEDKTHLKDPENAYKRFLNLVYGNGRSGIVEEFVPSFYDEMAEQIMRSLAERPAQVHKVRLTNEQGESVDVVLTEELIGNRKRLVDHLEKEYPQYASYSPSAQAYIDVHGKVEVLATHDQLLDGQTYLGAISPAPESVRFELQDSVYRIGQRLSSKDVFATTFAIDFIVAKHPKILGRSVKGEALELRFSTHEVSKAIEINLREGGTTHPLHLARILTRGHFDLKRGVVIDPQNREVHYLASDNFKPTQLNQALESGQSVKLDLEDMTKFLENEGLLFDPVTNTGVVMHMMGALPSYGKMGYVALEHGRLEAQNLSTRFEAAVSRYIEVKLQGHL